MNIKNAEQDVVSFNTGAEREQKVDKGRYDLLPIVVWEFMSSNYHPRSTPKKEDLTCAVFKSVAGLLNGDRISIAENIKALSYAAIAFLKAEHELPLKRLAVHFEQGGRNRGDRNWEKGIPLSSFLSSGMRHFEQYLNGYDDEPHLVAFVWNIVCLHQTMSWIEEGILPTYLNDLPIREAIR